MNSVEKYTDIAYIKILESSEKYSVIEELAKVFKGAPVCTDIESLITALKEREEIMSTGIGFGIAIPHAKIPEIENLIFAVGVAKEGIDFNSMDGKAVQLVILVAAGENQHKEYLGLLANIMAMLKKDNVKEKIINSDSPEEILSLISKNSK